MFWAFLILVVALSACSGGETTRRAQSEDADLNRCLRLSAKKHYAEAVECLEVFKSRYPASEKAVEAELRIGDSYFRKKDYLLAVESYRQFIRLHPDHERVDYAYYRIGLASLREAPKAIGRDQGSLADAIDAFGTVWQDYASSPYAKVAFLNYQKARTKAAEQNFYVAKFYYRTKEFRATLPRLTEIVTDYGDTGIAVEAAYLKFKSHLELGEIDRAQETLAFLQGKAPNHSLTAKASRTFERYLSAQAKADHKSGGS